jgi:hypothetical protein
VNGDHFLQFYPFLVLHVQYKLTGQVTGIYWSQAGNSDDKNINLQIAREYCQRDSNMESRFDFYYYQPKFFSRQAVDWNYGKYHQQKTALAMILPAFVPFSPRKKTRPTLNVSLAMGAANKNSMLITG